MNRDHPAKSFRRNLRHGLHAGTDRSGEQDDGKQGATNDLPAYLVFSNSVALS